MSLSKAIDAATRKAAAPTDAEVEAMAERLWDVWNEGMYGNMSYHAWAMMVGWSEVDGMYSRQVVTFRAMARAALGKLTDENGDEVRG